MKKIELCYISQVPERVDTLISTLFSDFSRSYIAKCINRWEILINWIIPKKNTILRYQDVISFTRQSYSLDILAENIPLDIIYEDENLIVLNKDAWINVHPVPWIDGKSGTLVNALLYHTKWNLPLIWWEERPGIVHRLDKDTSWLLLIAKTDYMMHYLSDIIQQRKIKKYYLAVTTRIPDKKEFTIKSQIGRDRYDRTKMTVRNPLNPKDAVTHVKVLWTYNEIYGLLKIDLETGRTHQIRVHLASIWIPILWDRVYGDTQENQRAHKKYSVTRQMLHAYELYFDLYKKPIKFISRLKSDIKIFFNNQDV